MGYLPANVDELNIDVSFGQATSIDLDFVDTAPGVVSLWVGGSLDDLDDTTGATEVVGSVASFVATFAIPAQTDPSQAVRLERDGDMVAAGYLKATTRGRKRASSTYTVDLSTVEAAVTIRGGSPSVAANVAALPEARYGLTVTGSSVDFDPIAYGRVRCWTGDEFFAANTVAGGIGDDSAWTGTTANSGAIADAALGDRGAVTLSTGTASASGSAKIEHARIVLLDLDQAADVSVGFKMRPRASSTAQAYLAEVGFKANATTHGAFFRFTAGSTITVHAVTNDGSNETTTSLTAATADGWEHLTVQWAGGDTWRFYRAGVLVATHTTHSPDLAILSPRAGITKTNGTGTARTIEVDRFDYVNALT